MAKLILRVAVELLGKSAGNDRFAAVAFPPSETGETITLESVDIPRISG
jgi:hypothetical protein